MASKKTPYGYILAEGKIAVDVEEADIIRRIFNEKADGLSGSKIGATLYDEQIPYFSEDKKKAIDKVYSILRDGRYCGTDGYPPIISEEVFGASNIGRNAKSVKAPDTYTVLKRLSYCTVCGTNMVHFSDRSGFKRWRCTHKGCANFMPRIPDDYFVSVVQSIMNAVVSNGDMLARMEQNILAVIGDNGDMQKQTAKIKKRLEEIEDERDSLVRQITSGAVDEDALDKNFESLNDEEACLKTQLDDMQTKAKLSDEKKYALMAVGEELRRHDCHLAEYDDVTVRKVIEVIRVLSKTEVQIIFKDGHEMNVAVEK